MAALFQVHKLISALNDKDTVKWGRYPAAQSEIFNCSVLLAFAHANIRWPIYLTVGVMHGRYAHRRWIRGVQDE